jgi:hypothetical protein
VRDEDARRAIAAVLLFTTPPTDRALDGWDPAGWADEELYELGVTARKSAVMR